MWPFRARRDETASPRPDGDPPDADPRAAGPDDGLARWDFGEDAELAPGRHVLKHVGGGTRHEVYLVWDESLFALAVAKVLRPDQVADARALRELGREADLLARLAHPCLVRGFSATLEGPRPHLVLEHVEGPTLGRLVRHEGALPLEQLLPLALHLLAVLHYLASSGVVHLDVKPGNVVMSAPPRLIDLSIARSVAEARALRHAIGTDAYMAPEQCAPGDAGAPGPPSDVWAAGATLFRAATGAVPFPRPEGAERSGDPGVRFPQLVTAPPAVPEALPAALREIIEAMLQPDPASRPTAREAAEALEPLVAAVPDRLARTRRGKLVVPRWRPPGLNDQP